MNVLWVGDACVSTGFARCTHAACDALHSAGHVVNVLGISYSGDPHSHPYEVWPCYQPHDSGYDDFGVGRLPHLIVRLRPDVVVLQNDPWNVPVYLRSIREAFESSGHPLPLIVGWLAVDAKNQRGDQLNSGLAAVATWTEWGLRELKAGGYEGSELDAVIPLGVDADVFHEQDRSESRGRLGLSKAGYFVGVVGRNQTRKRLDLSIQYFAEWIKSCEVDDAMLYLHIAPTGEQAFDVRSLVSYYGLNGRALLSEPRVGVGSHEDEMRSVYGAMDCYFSTTQGEGFGLPALEAMACGVPVIAPNWSGLGSWATAAELVPCSGTAITAPLGRSAYTVGGLMDRGGAVRALDRVYRHADERDRMRSAGLQLAARLPWSDTGRRVVDWLERVAATRARNEATRSPLGQYANEPKDGSDNRIRLVATR